MKIPEITDERLRELFNQIKPLVRDGRGSAREIEPVDLRSVSYLWSPEFTGKAVHALITIGEFRCLHTYGYYGFFKPSIAEVLCQIPEEMINKASFFEIVRTPTDADDLNKERKAVNAGFHVSTVRVYEQQ